jgi:glycosyltransferase involved in cell wall biosynthesis
MAAALSETDVTRRITVLIKTFQRPRTVNASIASIRRFYPSIPIIVADDSSPSVTIEDSSAAVHRLPFDSGVAMGRNFLIAQAQTEYFLMIDDDNVFSRDTRLERMIDELEAGDFDIMSCLILEGSSWLGDPRARRHVVDFQMNLELSDGTLRFLEPDTAQAKDAVRCDLVHQFFLARTAKVRATGGWDERLKTADHTDFFLRMKNHRLKVGFTPLAAAMHQDVAGERDSADYAPYRRDRAAQFRRIWIETYGIRNLVGRNGKIISADDFIRGRSGAGKLGNIVRRPAPPGLISWNRLRAAAAGLFANKSSCARD